MDLLKTKLQVFKFIPFTMKISIAFLMDCTGSMERWIQAAKTQIQTIVDTTRAQHGDDIHMRVGFVGYRDYGEQERFLVQDFTDVPTLLARIRDVHAEGGDDVAEDVAGGLHEIEQLSWDDDGVKLMIHIADAPPHGLQFHARYVSDRYPAGDPSGRNPLDSISKLFQRGIDYTFIQINHSTDTMVEQFSNSYLEAGRFKVLDLQGQQPELFLERSITDTLTASITHYTCSQDPAAVIHSPI